MPWYLYLALKQLFPSGRRLSFFFVMSVCGVMLGVMLLVIVQSVMGGFGRTYREMIVDTNGHLRVETRGVLYDWRPLEQQLQERPDVAAAAPYAHGVVMLQYRNRPLFPAIRGMDFAQEDPVIPLREFMTFGEVEEMFDDGCLLSSTLARRIGAGVGATIEVYTPLMLDRLKNDEILLPRELEVVGIYETGWNEFDSNTLVVTLRLMQELYALGDGVHGIAVRVADGVDEMALTRELNAGLDPPQRAVPWIEMYREFLWVLALEKNLMFFLLLFIVLVAAFAIAVAQLLTVLRKTREIGLLGALGGRGREVALCFCFQGFLIGLVGTVLGLALGLLALWFRNDIVSVLATITGSRDTLVQFYQFTQLPAQYNLADYVRISLAAIVLATIAGLLPARRAAKLKPAEALRHE